MNSGNAAPWLRILSFNGTVDSRTIRRRGPRNRLGPRQRADHDEFETAWVVRVNQLSLAGANKSVAGVKPFGGVISFRYPQPDFWECVVLCPVEHSPHKEITGSFSRNSG